MNLTSNPIFEIIISLTLIYALLSILVSIGIEWLNHYNEQRSKMLKSSLVKLLQDNNNLNYGELFYNHISIQALTKIRPRRHYMFLLENKNASPKKEYPNYISSSMFADVVMDIIGSQALHLQDIQLKKDSEGNIIKENGNSKHKQCWFFGCESELFLLNL